MRNYGSADPELCVARFLEERGQLYGIVNQRSWVKTFAVPEQHHCLTVKVYLLSYLEDTRETWLPSLEMTPPATPRRYREKFDQDRFPPPGSTGEGSPAEEVGTYGSYVPESDHDFGDGETVPPSNEASANEAIEESGVSFEEFEPESASLLADGRGGTPDEAFGLPAIDVVVPERDGLGDELPSEHQ